MKDPTVTTAGDSSKCRKANTKRGMSSLVRKKANRGCDVLLSVFGSVVWVGEGIWFSKDNSNCILTPFPNSTLTEILFKISKNSSLWAKVVVENFMHIYKKQSNCTFYKQMGQHGRRSSPAVPATVPRVPLEREGLADAQRL